VGVGGVDHRRAVSRRPSAPGTRVEVLVLRTGVGVKLDVEVVAVDVAELVQPPVRVALVLLEDALADDRGDARRGGEDALGVLAQDVEVDAPDVAVVLGLPTRRRPCARCCAGPRRSSPRRRSGSRRARSCRTRLRAQVELAPVDRLDVELAHRLAELQVTGHGAVVGDPHRVAADALAALGDLRGVARPSSATPRCGCGAGRSRPKLSDLEDAREVGFLLHDEARVAAVVVVVHLEVRGIGRLEESLPPQRLPHHAHANATLAHGRRLSTEIHKLCVYVGVLTVEALEPSLNRVLLRFLTGGGEESLPCLPSEVSTTLVVVVAVVALDVLELD
jgi:hypothetical protein